jgi:hypothetical protein
MSIVRSSSQALAASIFVADVAKSRADLLETVDHRLERREPFENVSLHRLGRIELRLLRQISHRRALGRPCLAGDVFIHASHDLEQRRFAGAVQPEDADFGARQERQPNVLQDFAAARIDLGEALHYVDVLVGCHGGGSAFRS